MMRRIAAALSVCGILLVGTACSNGHGEPTTGASSAGNAAASKPSSTKLPLALPNSAMVGTKNQPTQVDPNKVYPCTATEQSGATNMMSPLEDTAKYQMQFIRGGWCIFGPARAGYNAPLFTMLYWAKTDKQARINYFDALVYSREHFERKYGSHTSWKTEKVPPLNTDQDFTALVTNTAIKKSRRYTDVIVTTRSAVKMTMLLHFESPLNGTEARVLARNAASAAYRGGLVLEAH